MKLLGLLLFSKKHPGTCRTIPLGGQMCITVGVMDLVSLLKTALTQNDFEDEWVSQRDTTPFLQPRDQVARLRPSILVDF